MVERREEMALGRKRIFWGAVFAGVVVVLVTQLLLAVLGVAFGAGAIDPLQQGNPLRGLGLGSAIWLVVTALISLFAGGWVSGRLAAVNSRIDSLLHGVVTWGLATLVSFILITNLVAGIVTGTANMAGDVLGFAGQGVKAVAPQIADAVGQQIGIDNLQLSDLRQEAKKMLTQTRKEDLQPGNIERSAEKMGTMAKDTAGDMARNPQMAGPEIDSLVDRVLAEGKTVIEAADREALVNVLVARTEMSREAAGRTVDNWQTSLAQLKDKAGEVVQQVEDKALVAADTAAREVSQAAVWVFVALLLGLGAAAGGGWLGTPDSPRRIRLEPIEHAAAA